MNNTYSCQEMSAKCVDDLVEMLLVFRGVPVWKLTYGILKLGVERRLVRKPVSVATELRVKPNLT